MHRQSITRGRYVTTQVVQTKDGLSFNLSHFCSRSLSCKHCSLTVTLHSCSWLTLCMNLQFYEIFKYETRMCALKNFSSVCIYLCMKHTKCQLRITTFSDGRQSCIVVWQSSGYYQKVNFIPVLYVYFWSVQGLFVQVACQFICTV